MSGKITLFPVKYTYSVFTIMYITEKGKTFCSWNIPTFPCLLWPAILGQRCSVCRITCSPGQPSPASRLPCRAASAPLHLPLQWYKTPDADWHGFCRRAPKAMSCTVGTTKDADLCVKEKRTLYRSPLPGLLSDSFWASFAFFLHLFFLLQLCCAYDLISKITRSKPFFLK